jgi:hypothetical protein
MLVKLTHPARTREMRSADEQIDVWTSRTLAAPDPRPAMATAASTGRPVVVLTTHHLALAHLTGPPDIPARFVTTHGPRDRPPAAVRAGGRHFHLPPDPGPEQLTRVLTELLTP